MSDSPITKETLEYLAGLARIKLTPEEEERFLKELQGILEHVSELKKVDTAGVNPMNGGTLLKNVFRDDEERPATNQGKGIGQFPETADGALKIPPVFGTKE